jgi:hypothetical protein
MFTRASARMKFFSRDGENTRLTRTRFSMNPEGTNSTANAPAREPGSVPAAIKAGFLWVVFFWVALLAIRATGLQDLADGYHQGRAVAYVMDVLHNDNWICQWGARNDITSKPPMYTWLAAVSSLLFREPSWMAVALPAALATLGAALLVFGSGKRYFGWQAGLLGALAYLASPVGVKQIGLVRIDGLFSFSIALTAVAAFECWRRGKGWTWFWLAATFATFTKGPLGPVLGALGLLAVWWEKRSGHPAPIRGQWLPGLGLLLGIGGGWFWLAYVAMGQPLVEVMLGRELVGQVVREHRSGSLPFTQFYLPILYVMRSFVPWVFPGFVGLWRAFKHPDSDPGARQFERFVVCWFLGGLFVFSAAAHQRPDLIFPLVPPMAILSGREMARWMSGCSLKRFSRITATCAVIALGLAFGRCHIMERSDWKAVRTTAIEKLASEIRRKVGSSFPLNFVESDVIFQFYLGMKRPDTSYEAVAALFSQGKPVFVVLPDQEKLRKALGTNTLQLFELAAWKGEKESIYVLSNHPRLESTPAIAWQWGAIQVLTEDLKPLTTRHGLLVLQAENSDGKVRLQNMSSSNIRVSAQTQGELAGPPQVLAPQAVVEFSVRAGAAITLRYFDDSASVPPTNQPD